MGIRRKKERLKVSFGQAVNLLVPYIRKRVGDQARSVAVISIYLLLFQTLVLRVAVDHAVEITAGLICVVAGLAFFMEGLFLGIMPIGEAIGIKLPQKANLLIILLFSFVLGFGATLAEPAIGILRDAGRSVHPWNAPLLFLLFNKYPGYLVSAVGIGVGIAVITGVLRFLYNWSLKPIVVILVLALLAFSLWASQDSNLISLVGVAWDCGGITTGPITVPLVIALGIGICRVVKGARSGASGFGVVTLASLFPILTVMLLGTLFLHSVPRPMSEKEFVRRENRAEVLQLFRSEDQFKAYMAQYGGSEACAAVFGADTAKMQLQGGSVAAVRSGLQKETMPFNPGTDVSRGGERRLGIDFAGIGRTIAVNARTALKAIVPLCLFLVLVLALLLRERLNRPDEIAAGVVFAFVGLCLFYIGMELGLTNMGHQIGRLLPSTFEAIPLPDHTTRISQFDTSILQTAISPSGKKERFFYAKEGSRILPLRFDSSQFDARGKEYTYIPRKGPVAPSDGGIAGIALLLLFALIMGYGATLAEPALSALGLTVEELTVGTFRKKTLIQSVATGVGVGMALGLIKVVWNIPVAYLLIPPYLLALVLTIFSDDEYVNIGWDSAGVTTGPVTVPLVLAMGLGVASQMQVVEGFGIIALASVCPVVTVLMTGKVIMWRRKAMMKAIIGKAEDTAI